MSPAQFLDPSEQPEVGAADGEQPRVAVPALHDDRAALGTAGGGRRAQTPGARRDASALGGERQAQLLGSVARGGRRQREGAAAVGRGGRARRPAPPRPCRRRLPNRTAFRPGAFRRPAAGCLASRAWVGCAASSPSASSRRRAITPDAAWRTSARDWRPRAASPSRAARSSWRSSSRSARASRSPRARSSAAAGSSARPSGSPDSPRGVSAAVARALPRFSFSRARSAFDELAWEQYLGRRPLPAHASSVPHTAPTGPPNSSGWTAAFCPGEKLMPGCQPHDHHPFPSG